MIIVGIDPGNTGAIAFMRPNEFDSWDLAVHDCPALSPGKTTRKVPDPVGMSNLLLGMDGAHVYIEKVHAMPKNGSIGSFSLGENYGVWQGVIAAHGLAMTTVTPQAWKKKLLAGMPNGKDVSRLRAIQLMPKMHEALKRKKDHGRAEALLIAEYGRMHIGM